MRNNWKISTSTQINTANQSCKNGVATFCGVNPIVRSDAKTDSTRSFYPLMDRKCTFTDKYGSQVYSLCIDGINNFTRVVTEKFSLVFCPENTNVLGCGQQGTGGQTIAGSFPFTDYWGKTGCSCYPDSIVMYSGRVMSTNCYATCGSVNGYEIVSSYAVGTAEVTCPKGKTVLGCGFRTPLTDVTVADNYRAVYPSSIKSCTCEDSKGITCYAMCGYI